MWFVLKLINNKNHEIAQSRARESRRRAKYVALPPPPTAHFLARKEPNCELATCCAMGASGSNSPSASLLKTPPGDGARRGVATALLLAGLDEDGRTSDAEAGREGGRRAVAPPVASPRTASSCSVFFFCGDCCCCCCGGCCDVPALSASKFRGSEFILRSVAARSRSFDGTPEEALGSGDGCPGRRAAGRLRLPPAYSAMMVCADGLSTENGTDLFCLSLRLRSRRCSLRRWRRCLRRWSSRSASPAAARTPSRAADSRLPSRGCRCEKYTFLAAPARSGGRDPASSPPGRDGQ